MAGGLLVATSVYTARRLSEVWQGDYLTYAAGARRFLDGEVVYPHFQLLGPFYLGEAAFGHGFVYSPLALYAALPFALLDDQIGFDLFATLSAVALGLVAYAICRREGLGTAWSLAGTMAVMLAGPSLESIATGQANTLVAAAFGLAWLTPSTSGYLGVLGAMVKLYPGTLLVWSVRMRAPVSRPLLLGVLVLAASLAVQGPGLWTDFATTVRNSLGNNHVFPMAPRHVLEQFVGGGPALAISVILTGFLLLAVLRVRSRYLAFGILGFAAIFPSPDWYLHYFVVPLIACLPGAAAWLCGETQRRSSLTASATSTI